VGDASFTQLIPPRAQDWQSNAPSEYLLFQLVQNRYARTVHELSGPRTAQENSRDVCLLETQLHLSRPPLTISPTLFEMNNQPQKKHETVDGRQHEIVSTLGGD
jgi:hypothetical protein